MEENNYKVRQKYYNELYKNRAKEFFAQPLPYKNKNGEIVKPKGKTYIKPKEEK